MVEQKHTNIISEPILELVKWLEETKKIKNTVTLKKWNNLTGMCIIPEKEVGITLTFGDVSENHVGMEKYGFERDGFSYKETLKIYNNLKDNNYHVEFIKLHKLINTEEPASLIIFRKALNTIFKDESDITEKFFQEHLNLDYDKHYFDIRRNKVLQKHARYNLTYNNFNREPDYTNRKGRIISFEELPYLNSLREKLPQYFSTKAKDLFVESNKYYDLKKTYIGLHGDAERNITIGLRLGNNFDLAFQWYHKNLKIGDPIILKLNSGDMYLMSKKTTGNDWKKSSVPTLRHCAGTTEKIKSMLAL